MSYNPKSLIKTDEHGDNFEFIEKTSQNFLTKAKVEGCTAEIRAALNIEGTTRYARSQVTQHTDLNTIQFSLRLVQGKKLATGATSDLSPAGLDLLFQDTLSTLHRTPETPFYQGLPAPRSGSNVDLSGKDWTMESRADTIIEIVNAAQEIDPKVILAGTATETLRYTRVISTEGVDTEDSAHVNYFKVNAITGSPEERGYGQEELYWRYTLPSFSELANTATQTAKDTEKIETVDAGKHEVLLGPQAVADLMVYVMFSMDATSFHESNSFASDRLGDQIFDEKLTIRNLPRDPTQATLVRNFDEEGMITQNQMLFDKGVLKFIPYSSFHAAKYLDDKNLATGDYVSLLFGANAFPVSMAVDAGNKSLDDQIGEMEDGLYVKNFWYNRFTLRREGGLTGLTRNGLYHVKDGEIKGAVRNLRYTESFVNAFGPNNIISIGKNRTKFELSNCPAMHLKSYNFSSIAHSFD